MKPQTKWSLFQARRCLSALLLLSVGACSSSERTDLLLIQVDWSATPTAKTLKLTVTDATTSAPVKEESSNTSGSSTAVAKIGLPLPSGTTGSVLVKVTAYDGLTELGSGTGGPQAITPGKNAGPVSVTIQATSVVQDGGLPDATVSDGPHPADAGTPDLAQGDTGPASDGPTAGADTGPSADTQGTADGRSDLPPTETGAQPDAATDSPTVVADAAPDSATVIADAAPDVSVERDINPPSDSNAPADANAAEVGAPADAAVDVAPDAGGTILTALNSCKRYVHYPNSPATCVSGSDQENIIVYSTVFTPDGKYLATAGNNTWVKLWKVVDTGLEDTQVVFVGTGYRVTASISPAGDILALGNPDGNIALYDLTLAIQQGAVSQTGTLPISKLTSTPDGFMTYMTFTTDGKQIIATYPPQDSSNNSLIVVWDVATGLPVRQITRNGLDIPMAVSSSPSTGPIWMASAQATEFTDDAGSYYYQSTITLEDVSTTGGAKPTFTVPGQVDLVGEVAFSADQKTLAIGTEEGEVGLWDISVKNNIQRLGSPLVAGTTTGSADTVWALAYSRGGAYLTVGSWIYRGPSSLRVANLQTRAVTQRQYDYEPRSFGFASDGTTWAFGLGGCGYVYYCKN